MKVNRDRVESKVSWLKKKNELTIRENNNGAPKIKNNFWHYKILNFILSFKLKYNYN